MADVQKLGADEKFCSSCGTIIKKEAAVCPSCGISQQRLEQAIVNNINEVKRINKKWVTLLLLSIWLGWLGIHRFYVKKYGTGIIWLFTVGLSGIGWLIDIIFVLTGQFKDKQGNVIPIKI